MPALSAGLGKQIMRIAVGHPTDLSDSYLRFVTQLGVDCIDFVRALGCQESRSRGTRISTGYCS